jgi:hypothetical protein
MQYRNTELFALVAARSDRCRCTRLTRRSVAEALRAAPNHNFSCLLCVLRSATIVDLVVFL